jgi:ribosomal protein S21
MAYVVANPKEDFEMLYRRFKRKVIDEKIIAEYKEHTYFTSASEKRRRYEQEIAKKIKRANSRRKADAIKEL